MICENTVRKYCCEDISLIENYQEAINSDEKWDCHHRLEIELNKSVQELKDLNLYFNRPANELIFLTKSEHIKIHNSINKIGNKNTLGKHYCLGEKNGMYGVHRFGKDNPMYGKHHSDETKQKMKKPHKYTPKRKDKWLTPTGEIIMMDKRNAKVHHPDWKLIEESF